MFDESETERVEQQPESGPADQPTVWELTQRVAGQPPANELPAAHHVCPSAVPPREPLARIAAEMHRRARWLRSRGAGFSAKLELEIVWELDAIEARARELDARRRGGAASEISFAEELDNLALAVFAVRGRFEALVERQDLAWSPRAEPSSAEERRRELAAIEEFMARKRGRAAV